MASPARIHFPVWVRTTGTGEALPRLGYGVGEDFAQRSSFLSGPRYLLPSEDQVHGGSGPQEATLKSKHLHSRNSLLFTKDSWVSFWIPGCLGFVIGLLCDLRQAAFPLCPQFWRVLEGVWRHC